MTAIHLTKYFKKAVIYPGLLIVVGYVAFGIFDGIFGAEYQSEWLTKGGVIFTSIFMVTLNAMFIGVLTIPIFLNHKLKISSNVVVSLLTWFLCPTIWITYLLAKHYSYLTNFSHRIDGESVFVFSNTIPYFIGLIWTFINFRQDLKSNYDSTKELNYR